MEALLKEGGGGDHITVGVKLPSGTLQRPISQEDIYIRPPPGTMQLHRDAMRQLVNLTHVLFKFCHIFFCSVFSVHGT